jgi:intein/homing endonuclease
MSIEDATAGDIVKSYNMLTTDLGESIVGEFFEVQREGYYELTFDNGKVLKITDDHPVYTQYGWAAINPMRAKANPGYSTLGDVTLLSEGSCVLTESKQLVTLVHVLYVEGDITTYTLGKVSPNANFFAEGFLVSNRIC